MVFSQFRSQYPHGSIITEMLSKVDGQHTFRAVIKNQPQQGQGDTILSTATAVDSDLETAEDRAIKRALTNLGITSEYGMQATLMPQIISEISPDIRPQISPQLNSQISKLQPPINYKEQLLVSAALDPDSFSGDLASNNYSINHVNNLDGDLFTASLARDDRGSSTGGETENSPTKSKAKSTKTQDLAKQEPIDLSSQLSQIMVEMERIGWTKQQGKDHLQRQYKKTSRDQLSASEVFDFLEYLQSQSDTF
jgi:hypothetical protein